MEEYTRNLPEAMRGGLRRYLHDGVLPGSFLRAVLENDLVAAAGAADEKNRTLLFEYAAVLYNAFPARSGGACWGSRQAVEDWAALGGLNGLRRTPRKFSKVELGGDRAARLARTVNAFGGHGEVVA